MASRTSDLIAQNARVAQNQDDYNAAYYAPLFENDRRAAGCIGRCHASPLRWLHRCRSQAVSSYMI